MVERWIAFVGKLSKILELGVGEIETFARGPTVEQSQIVITIIKRDFLFSPTVIWISFCTLSNFVIRVHIDNECPREERIVEGQPVANE